MATSNFGSEKFTPLVGYWCLPNGHLNDDERHVLTDLYLPILGTEAFSLYLLLWEKLPNKQLVTQRKSHAELMSLLGIDLKRFYEARIKAEALGLIRTFAKKDDLGPYYVYQLFEPLSPDDFFKDDLMSIFLYEQVGETKYHLLADKYAHSDLILKDSQEITKDFLEVFQLSNSDLINTPAEVKTAQSNFNSDNAAPKPSLNENKLPQLDWELISDRIQQLFKISPDDLLLNQELILNLHAFYGLDEITLIDLIGKTCDIVNNKIDPDRLKRLVQDRFEKNANIAVKQQETVTETNDQPTTNLNRSDQLILKQAKSMTPADFLAAQKQKSGGFTGTVESRALRDMAMKSYLPASVLNIMVYYILQNSPTLTLPLMETMANDWQQNDVQTPEQALQRINDFQNKPRNPKRRYNNNKNRKVEQATDWTKVRAKVPNDPNNEDNHAQLQDRLKRLRNKDK
ncbi:replication initiation protein [Companilactobacillus crustorum]|uniref:Chromosome replication initiation membrane attachment protein B n=3 Tax=Companilactobacillus TaxID=2767879 RepID=A0A837RHK2_9LACO|nr:DnaD domain protein [Companilactobacillus crustorum]KRK41934.1 chromosome replication initiation membrane attachment protein B [Companilactobacillus crustorum JCM 15951]KRO19937.1 chromosome replication initiation membrane attachment protein B [Companilactobacillus crustorum]GEO77043.1 replication initiation protein [Companilactobacillus crustorum]